MRDDLDPAIVTLLDQHKGGGRVVARAPEVHALFDKGRYIPRSLTRIIGLVARHADISPEAICGAGRYTRLVNARFCIGKLAEEFAPRQSARAVDGALLRGEGCTVWYRDRHADRMKLYTDYAALYERCRAELLVGGRT